MIGEIFFTVRNSWVVADNSNRPILALRRTANFANLHLIIKRYRQHNGIEQMITIGAPADNAQSQIDFCRRSNLHGPLGNIRLPVLRKCV